MGRFFRRLPAALKRMLSTSTHDAEQIALMKSDQCIAVNVQDSPIGPIPKLDSHLMKNIDVCLTANHSLVCYIERLAYFYSTLKTNYCSKRERVLK